MDNNNYLKLNFKSLITLLDALNDNQVILICTDTEVMSSIYKNFSFIHKLFDSNVNNDYIDEKYSDIRIRKISVLLKEIETKADNILSTISLLLEKNSNLLSITDLYGLINKDITEYNIYIKLKEALTLDISSMSWLKEFVIDLDTSFKLKNYVKYKKFENNKFLKFNTEHIIENDFTTTINKLDGILNNKYSLTPPIYINKYTDDFINLKLPLDISEEDLLSYCNTINIKYNSSILSKLKKLKWYDILLPKRYNTLKKENIDLLNDFENTKNIIYKEYKENIEFLNLYLHSFSFLNSVINNPMKELEKLIYDEDEMYSYLSSIRKNLLMYQEFLKIKDEVEKLDSREVAVFDFCYKNSTTILECQNLLLSLPNLLLYKYIDKFEENESLGKYTSVNNLVNFLDESINILFNKFIVTLKDTPRKIKVLLESDVSNEALKKSKIYYINEIEQDFCILLLNNYNNLSSLKPVDLSNTKQPNNNHIKDLIHAIKSLGYNTIINFNYNNFNLELIVSKEKSYSRFVYIHIDQFIEKEENDLLKLLFLTNNKIPIYYYWSKNFWLDKNIELLNLKKFLQENLL